MHKKKGLNASSFCAFYYFHKEEMLTIIKILLTICPLFAFQNKDFSSSWWGGQTTNLAQTNQGLMLPSTTGFISDDFMYGVGSFWSTSQVSRQQGYALFGTSGDMYQGSPISKRILKLRVTYAGGFSFSTWTDESYRISTNNEQVYLFIKNAQTSILIGKSDKYFIEQEITDANWEIRVRGYTKSNWEYVTRCASANANIFPRIQGTGKLYSVQFMPIVSEGTWTSDWIDLGGKPLQDGTISWAFENPVGTSIDIRTQTASESDPTNWSNWSAPYADNYGSTITGLRQRWLRVSATLHGNTDLDVGPTLKSVHINYPSSTPQAPLVSMAGGAAAYVSSNALTLAWRQPDTDAVTVGGYFAALDADLDTTVASGALGTAHGLSLTSQADGTHLFRLVAQGDTFSGALFSPVTTFAFTVDTREPSVPVIQSATHPQGQTANNNSPTFTLASTDATSGLAGYAVLLDHQPGTEAGITVTATMDQVEYKALENGSWYLHVRAVDRAGNVSGQANYAFRVEYVGDIITERQTRILPNPVRTDTVLVEYELAAPASGVEVTVLDTRGRELEHKAGGQEPGFNRVSFDAHGAANGVYFVRVRAKAALGGKENVVIKKMALVR